jgi:hypothetical protein
VFALPGVAPLCLAHARVCEHIPLCSVAAQPHFANRVQSVWASLHRHRLSMRPCVTLPAFVTMCVHSCTSGPSQLRVSRVANPHPTKFISFSICCSFLLSLFPEARNPHNSTHSGVAAKLCTFTFLLWVRPVCPLQMGTYTPSNQHSCVGRCTGQCAQRCVRPRCSLGCTSGLPVSVKSAARLSFVHIR